MKYLWSSSFVLVSFRFPNFLCSLDVLSIWAESASLLNFMNWFMVCIVCIVYWKTVFLFVLKSYQVLSKCYTLSCEEWLMRNFMTSSVTSSVLFGLSIFEKSRKISVMQIEFWKSWFGFEFVVKKGFLYQVGERFEKVQKVNPNLKSWSSKFRRKVPKYRKCKSNFVKVGTDSHSS